MKKIQKKFLGEKARAFVELFNVPEGRVLMIGIILVLVYFVLLGLTFIFSSENFQLFIAMTSINIIFGRAAAISFGYTVGLSHGIVLFMNMYIETFLVFLFYPLFVFSWRRLIVFKGFVKMFDTIRQVAESKQKQIRRYGMLGLFGFVFFPFWMTGPVVGCIIGFLLGIRIWLNFTVVLSGTYLAIFCWDFFIKKFHGWMVAIHSYAPAVSLITILGIIVICSLLYKKKHNNMSKRQI